MNVTSISANLNAVQQRIADSSAAAGRAPQEITLVAVSKTKPVSAIEAAWQAGQRHFGENYLQEALEKVQQLHGKGIHWHFIGPLQSNKTRLAAENFDWVHTIERIKVARRLNDQRPSALSPLNICLQVNIDGEASKSGISPQQLPELAAAVAPLGNLRLRGLMAIPAPDNDPQQQRQTFARLAQLLDNLRRQLPDQHHLDTLSMGMSGDMDAAIAAGSTMVRIGTDVFGKREPGKQHHND
ncbi:YggS family pyridoxal phosphate-dependent enzyme [Porticoccus sp. W117]|uniref:YggS family pyridoxal phosphate-dependent enzyme n=1 Tax=Porticoccus sp. W117 TaxID=3054777 RepID=UPI00259622FC|nr:YggS family pyridoxal phosphate-dependent enzyme [Porticoccus sp. W117]MDM3872045.1 YggS family pyridoxal phosphate-dependent enzyme [Porticoccus sp. W117]